ncbi:MAG: AAA family ATPase, partial [Planctomycetota bacterium]
MDNETYQIDSIRIKNFLSFGPSGVELKLEPLNVLIGVNGSGKTNFLLAIRILQSASDRINFQFRNDVMSDWLWKGQVTPPEAEISCFM